MRTQAATVPSIADAVGEFLRDWRATHGVTLDVIATEAHRYGAQWSASSVSNIERGQAALTLPVLLMLALVLGDLSGEPVRLSDLLGSAEMVSLPFAGQPEKPVLRSWIDRVLSGDVVSLTKADHGHAIAPASSPHSRASRGAASLAETRAAKKLGITTHRLRLRAQSRWGRSLEDEVTNRAGSLATPQARGRVTRVLVEEIRTTL